MSRILNKSEQAVFIANRGILHEQLAALQADFEDFTDEELVECRATMLNRVNCCLTAILETDEDNIDESTFDNDEDCQDCACLVEENGVWFCDECSMPCCKIQVCPEGIFEHDKED